MNEAQAAQELRDSFEESVLLQISERGGSMTHEELDDFTGDPMATRDSLVELHELRMLEQPDSEGGRLTASGARTATRIRQSLLSGQRRADIVQRKLLEWLTGRSIEPSSILDFLVTPESSSSGVAITRTEVEQAADLLTDRGFIRIVEVAEQAWLRPQITADGRAALMADVMISEYGRPNATTVNYDYSSRVTFGDHATAGGVISGGQGNTQHIVQTIGAAEATKISDKASELLALVDGLPEDDEELRKALEQLRDEAKSPEPRTSVLKELTHKALAAAVTAGGTALGQQILSGIAYIAQLNS